MQLLQILQEGQHVAPLLHEQMLRINGLDLWRQRHVATVQYVHSKVNILQGEFLALSWGLIVHKLLDLLLILNRAGDEAHKMAEGNAIYQVWDPIHQKAVGVIEGVNPVDEGLMADLNGGLFSLLV